jgi:hypothetical protein
MKTDENRTIDDRHDEPVSGYCRPTVTFLGTLAELTQEKEVGAADGTTFLGLDIGS